MTITRPRLILASVSPRRLELLARLGVRFEVVPSQVEEVHEEHLGTAALCEKNAQAKAESVAGQFPGAVVLGSDTLVTRNGRVYGKPRDLGEAEGMLLELQGRPHTVISGVCLVQANPARKEIFHESTEVEFKPLSLEQIRGYIAAVHVLDKAGAYAIQEKGDMIIERIIGSYSNVVGLPLEKVRDALERWGFELPPGIS